MPHARCALWRSSASSISLPILPTKAAAESSARFSDTLAPAARSWASIAGGGELAGYAIRSAAGVVADRTGLYLLDVWVGYAINMLCVPALALAGSWPLAAGLVVGERVGRGIRKPVTAAMLSHAGSSLGSGRVFGINEFLDQTGATLGPLVVAFAVARGGLPRGFGILIVPALVTLAVLGLATAAGRPFVPTREAGLTLRRRFAIREHFGAMRSAARSLQPATSISH